MANVDGLKLIFRSGLVAGVNVLPSISWCRQEDCVDGLQALYRSGLEA